jgi:hypothetical protein
MAAFMEESGVEKWNRPTHREGILRTYSKIIAFHQGQFSPLQFLENQIRICLFKQQRLVDDYPFRAAETVTDDVVSKGGDESMHQD